MSVAEALSRSGVAPIAELTSTNAVLYAPGAAPQLKPASRTPQDDAWPLVSCLMVTSGERCSIRSALECYRRQTYQNREIVIVTYLDRVDALQALVDESGVAGASIHGVGRDLALGEMRNVSVGRSRGQILMHWDDDDLYDPARIAVAKAMLASGEAACSVLWRLLFWWPERRLAAVSNGRLWEPTMAVRRGDAPVYPSLNRMEDSHALEFVAKSRPVVAYDMPLLYIYVVHGGNTCEAEHFEGHVARANLVLRGADYLELLDLLATRMPIREYRPGAIR